MRSGLITQKVGMTRIIDEAGYHIPVTVLKLDDCQVIAVKTQDHHGYTAVQLGCGKAKVKNVSKPMRGHFARAKVEPKKKLVEFRVSEDNLLAVGDLLTTGHIQPGQYVDASGITIGKGFAGVMKRHNFRGLRASHGVSIAHRSHGSTGSNQDPGRVWKNKRMAGHMGVDRVTVQNLLVVSTDEERGLILVKGAVPGAKGSYILLQDAIKKIQPQLKGVAGIRKPGPQESVAEPVAATESATPETLEGTQGSEESAT